MKASNQLIEKIKEFEGLRLRAYRDSGGKPTIGYGHTLGVEIAGIISLPQMRLYGVEIDTDDNFIRI